MNRAFHRLDVELTLAPTERRRDGYIPQGEAQFIVRSIMNASRAQALNELRWADEQSIDNCPNFTRSPSISSARNTTELLQHTIQPPADLSHVWGRAPEPGHESRYPYGSAWDGLAVGANGHAYRFFGRRESLRDLRSRSLEKIWIHHPG